MTNEKHIEGIKIVRIRSDHENESDNASFCKLCEEYDIFHEFSAPKTAEQNGVVERKNRSLQKMAR